MVNLAKFLLRDFKKKNSKKSIKYFRSHGGYGYIIWLTVILEYKKKIQFPLKHLLWLQKNMPQEELW